MADNIFNNFDIAYNSIADQKLTAANTLTIKVWNEIITTLKTQANVNAKYLTALNKWLIGEDQVSIPGENSFVDYINTYIGAMPNTVMDIVNKNSLGFTTIDIGYSTNYNITSDKELPTTKAVDKMIEGPRKSIADIEETLEYKADLVDGKVPLEQLDTKETGELLVGTSTNYDTSRDDQIPTTKAVGVMVNDLKNSVDNKLTKKADLDESGKVPASQLPGYVDDVIEVSNQGDLPIPGESGKIYIVKSTNITYRWSGTQYTVIGKDLALGETPSTAFPGDRGKELELTSVKKTKENVQNTSLREIRKNYGDVVAAQYDANKYVLLVFGKTVNEKNECSLTVYDNGKAKYAKNVWLDLTLGQALNAAADFDSEYTYTDAKIDSLISASPMSTYELDLTEASWVRLAKVKDLQKNSSGLFIFDCYGKKVNDEGTVLDSVLHTTLKPEHKYEFGMEYTLRELYNYTSENRPFEIVFYTSHDNRLTALYWSPDSYIVNNKTIAPSDPTQPSTYGDFKDYIAYIVGTHPSVYTFDRKHNEEDGTEFYTLNPTYKGGFTTSYAKLYSATVKKEACRLLMYGHAYVYSEEYGEQQLHVIPPYTLYCNGVEIFRNTTYIRDALNIPLDGIKECSILVDHINAEDVYTIEYDQHPEADIEIVNHTLASVYDMDNTILTVKGYIEGTNEYIESESTSCPIPCPMEYGTHQEILTTSTFNVTCGLDDNGNLITDVLPITQSPELSGTDSSGGGSGGEIPGSGGSGLTGTHGLASIVLENYEGETYVCGLINFPNTGNYLGTYIEMKIENNLNFETLNRLEVVDLEAKTNNGEFQLLEGTVFESGNSYDFVIKSTLSQFVDRSAASFVLNDFTILRVVTGNPLIVNNVVHNFTVESTYIEETLFDTFNRFPIDINIDFIKEYSILEFLTEGPSIGKDNIMLPDLIKAGITKLAGTLTLTIGDTSEGADTTVSVTYNGITSTYQFDEDGEGGYKNIELYFSDITLDSLINIEGNTYWSVSFDIDRENTEVEIKTFGYTPEKDFELNQYVLDPAATVKGASYKFHKTSDSYDLFSVYNKLDRIEERVKLLQSDLNLAKNIYLDADTSMVDPITGPFNDYKALIISHYVNNRAVYDGKYFIHYMAFGDQRALLLIKNRHSPLFGAHLFLSDCEIVFGSSSYLSFDDVRDLYRTDFKIICNNLIVDDIDIPEILVKVIAHTTLSIYPFYTENDYVEIYSAPQTMVTVKNKGQFYVNYTWTYQNYYDEEGYLYKQSRLQAEVINVLNNTKYTWDKLFNENETGSFTGIHEGVYTITHNILYDYTVEEPTNNTSPSPSENVVEINYNSNITGNEFLQVIRDQGYVIQDVTNPVKYKIINTGDYFFPFDEVYIRFWTDTVYMSAISAKSTANNGHTPGYIHTSLNSDIPMNTIIKNNFVPFSSLYQDIRDYGNTPSISYTVLSIINDMKSSMDIESMPSYVYSNNDYNTFTVKDSGREYIVCTNCRTNKNENPIYNFNITLEQKGGEYIYEYNYKGNEYPDSTVPQVNRNQKIIVENIDSSDDIINTIIQKTLIELSASNNIKLDKYYSLVDTTTKKANKLILVNGRSTYITDYSGQYIIDIVINDLTSHKIYKFGSTYHTYPSTEEGTTYEYTTEELATKTYVDNNSSGGSGNSSKKLYEHLITINAYDYAGATETVTCRTTIISEDEEPYDKDTIQKHNVNFLPLSSDTLLVKPFEGAVYLYRATHLWCEVVGSNGESDLRVALEMINFMSSDGVITEVEHATSTNGFAIGFRDTVREI